MIIDDEIINTSSILQKVIILLCSLYSHSNINQNLVYNQSIFKNNNTLKKILEICYNNISFSTNNLDKLAKNFNNNNIDKYLIVSNKSIKENLILKEIPNNSSILYWFVDDSFIPSYEISIDRIKKSNATINIKEMTTIEKGLNINIFSGCPSVIFDILVKCKNYKTQYIIDKMISLYINY